MNGRLRGRGAPWTCIALDLTGTARSRMSEMVAVQIVHQAPTTPVPMPMDTVFITLGQVGVVLAPPNPVDEETLVAA
jgi:hypothetical protein